MLMLMSFKNFTKTIAVALLLITTQFAIAQDRVVSGRVTDSKDGSGVSGVSVTPKGSSTGTSTAPDGTFKITVGSGINVLVFTSVGYNTQEVNITGKSTVTVVLVISNTQLGEVIVSTGYGTRKVKDATGSVAAISPKDFNKGVISTPEQLFQGRTPGVTVTPGNGEPGAAATINIRGTSSIRGNNDPLFVVDGVPLDGGGTSGGISGIEGSQTPKNPLMFINPNDIESISILKDASSAAIYGSRGANGVIIITTKAGKSKKGTFSFNSSTSVSTTAKRYDLLNASDFLAAVKKANIDAGTSPADAALAVLQNDKGASTDWQDEIFRTGVSQNYNLAWGFANKGTSLRLSGSYDDQKGIVKSSDLKRLTGRVNYLQKFLKDDKLKLDITLTYSNIKNSYSPNSNNAGYQGSLIGAAIAYNPTFPVFGSDGHYFDPGDGNRNPAELIAYFDDKDNINRLLTSVSASYEIIKGLTYKVTYGYDNSKSLRKAFADPRLSSAVAGGTTNVNGVDYGNGISGNGRASYQDLKVNTNLVEHTLTYNKSFGTQDLNAIAGYSYQSTEATGSARVGWGLNTPVVTPTDVFIKDINNFKNIKAAYIPFYNKIELQSYFARVNYTINNKYLLTATVRIDGSSKFGENNKYGTFPAFAAKWRLINEEFAKPLGKVFADFSLRANYGKLGSQDGLGAYDAIDLQQIYLGNSGTPSTSFVHQGNKELKWEEATTTGAGLDFALKGNRLTGTIDYFYTKRKNLLFFGPTPGGFSATSFYYSNLPGFVRNRGWEFSFNYQALKKTKLKWDIAYNMTFLHNELADFNVKVNTGGVNGQGLSGAYAQTFQNGYPLFTWKMPVFQGFDGNGDARYANGAQDQLLGSALPTFTAGLTNSFSLGQWSASMFLNTSMGFYVYNNTANALLLKGSIKTAHNIDYATANSNEDPINPGSVSSRFLEKGDFLRLSNALVSYTFNLKSKAIKTLSASLSGQNLFLITNYSGLDPEVNVDHGLGGVPSRGFDYVGYPKARTITLGVNLGF